MICVSQTHTLGLFFQSQTASVEFRVEHMETNYRETLQADFDAFDISEELGFILEEPLVRFLVIFSFLKWQIFNKCSKDNNIILCREAELFLLNSQAKYCLCLLTLKCLVSSAMQSLQTETDKFPLSCVMLKKVIDLMESCCF